jgi:phosphatidate cytidylyltransferase
VPDADPGSSGTKAASGSELALRVASSLLLAPLAVGAAYIGGWPFMLFWGLAALGIFWEWTWLVAGERRKWVLALGGSALVIAVALASIGRPAAALIAIALGGVAAGAMAPRERRGWSAAGLPYAGAIGVAPIMLRSDNQDGFLAMVFLFAIVWSTDSVAYFCGRLIGGPKLLPRVSPKKTWSGAIGGLIGAVAVAVVVGRLAALAEIAPLAGIGAVLSIFSQGGDLFESQLKRTFGAKDSSHLIPGHGGLMDRLDGFVVAAAVAALVGILRGGIEAPARGLLVW